MRTPHSGAIPRRRSMEKALRPGNVENGKRSSHHHRRGPGRSDQANQRPRHLGHRFWRPDSIHTSTEMKEKRLGEIPLRILTFLINTPCSTDRIAEAFQSQIPRGYVEKSVGILRDRGLIHSKWRQWHVTRDGQARVPAVQPRRPSVFSSTYTPPPTPPRRPGSDHSHLPSIQGGQKVYRK